MLKEMKVMPVITTLEKNEKPMFAPELIRMMKDTAYETLRTWMEQSKAPPEAIGLLDDLVLTFGWDIMTEGGKVNWVQNQSMTEALGAMSYNIAALVRMYKK